MLTGALVALSVSCVIAVFALQRGSRRRPHWALLGAIFTALLVTDPAALAATVGLAHGTLAAGFLPFFGAVWLGFIALTLRAPRS